MSHRLLLFKKKKKIYHTGGYIPIMTSDTTPAPFVVSCNTIASSATDAYKALDGTPYTLYCCGNNDPNAYLQIKLDKKIKIWKYMVQARTDPWTPYGPIADWALYGSNNGTDWEQIGDTVVNGTWTLGEKKFFLVSMNKSYQHFKWAKFYLAGEIQIYQVE
jgi:hypothetical protein